jgi:hypothetical protein
MGCPHPRSGAGLFQHSNADAWFVLLALGHGAMLLAWPSLPLIALGLWWNSNTIAHNFLHLPFFRSAGLNRLFGAYLSVLLGIPQRLWRDRHLAHHADRPWRLQVSFELLVQLLLVAAWWAILAGIAPAFFWKIYLPGWALGLGLCQVQGYYEHARGTTSHYSRIYNLLCFNDGYHIEHHRRPWVHWRKLPERAEEGEPVVSAWPACFRWLEVFSLETLEASVLRSRALQDWVLRRHEAAWCQLLHQISPARRITIVGGGMFPRTALILRRLLPRAQLTIVDLDEEHLAMAQPYLDRSVCQVQARYGVDAMPECDLLVIPLSLQGDRDQFYQTPIREPSRMVLVHEWLWRPRGQSVVVSYLLLKRLNLIQVGSTPAASGAARSYRPSGCRPTLSSHA